MPSQRGALLMIVSVLNFAMLMLLVRALGETVSVFMLLLTRQVVMQVVVLFVARRRVRTLLHTRTPALQFWRSVLALAATMATYVSFIRLPLALASAISFSTVLFVTLGAVLFLRERVTRGIWIATIIGLIGVLIMLSPREGGASLDVLVAICGAVASAGMILTVRVFDPSDSIETVLTYQGLLTLAAAVVPVILTWQTPTAAEAALLLAVGLVSTFGQWTFVTAYRYEEAARLAPLDFLRLVVLAAAGLIFFHERPGLWLFAGIIPIIGATLYILRSNSRAIPARARTEVDN
ncbi:DMT family transporter [Rhizobium sp. CC-YZS058]|uniref:DMT family transporter n=1 Tax=Rhizobium sp. CC-YZS058 TaxID=3042153 RepID=UPI002B055505|nr:DMT family transporter [Rhizobium sp. CC-YZS058]MEA3536656.1 DMT family transporter [Rhizobium sp. CC-YZS058]